jgi:hypothetical protein
MVCSTLFPVFCSWLRLLCPGHTALSIALIQERAPLITRTLRSRSSRDSLIAGTWPESATAGERYPVIAGIYGCHLLLKGYHNPVS